MGRAALTEGVEFNRNTAVLSQFLSSDPALYQEAGNFARGGTELGYNALMGLGDLALSRGDMTAFNVARRKAATAGLDDDTEYQRLAGIASRREDDSGLQVEHWVNQHSGWLKQLFSIDPIEAADKQRDQYKNGKLAQGADISSRDTDDSLDYGRAKYDSVRSDTDLRIVTGDLTAAGLSGMSAQEMQAFLPGIQDASSARIASDQLLIQKANERISRLNSNDPHNQSTILANKTDIAGFQADINSAKLPYLQAAKSIFQQGITENEAAFDLGATQHQFEGWSPRQMAPALVARADYYDELADQPNPLDPAAKRKLKAGALNLRYKADEDALPRRPDPHRHGARPTDGSGWRSRKVRDFC